MTGAPWSTSVLRGILISPRIAGFTTRHGEPSKERSDKWEPLIDEQTWNDVRAILMNPDRKRSRVPRRYLLGFGVLRCGSCGGRLVAAPQRNREGALVRRYACRKDRGGCGKVSALAEPIEEIVSDAAKLALSDPEFIARLNGEGGGSEDDVKLRAEIARLESRIAGRQAATTTTTRSSARSSSSPSAIVCNLAIDDARKGLAVTTKRRPSALLAGIDDVDEQWKSYGPDRQRALIDLCFSSVTVLSANGRAKAHTFDRSRVRKPGSAGLTPAPRKISVDNFSRLIP